MPYHTGEEVCEEQFDFVQGKGTSEAMLVFHNITENADVKNSDTERLMFIDFDTL